MKDGEKLGILAHMCGIVVGNHWLQLEYGRLFQTEDTTYVKAGGKRAPGLDAEQQQIQYNWNIALNESGEVSKTQFRN